MGLLPMHGTVSCISYLENIGSLSSADPLNVYIFPYIIFFKCI